MNLDLINYDYKDHLASKISQYATHPNIRFFGQNHDKGKTFEYELSLCNVDTPILITDSISNKSELVTLLDWYKNKKPLTEMFDELRVSDTNEYLENAINAITDISWTEEDKKKAIIASRYLSSVGKGENALELANTLEANLLLPEGTTTIGPASNPVSIPVASVPATSTLRVKFNVPVYLRDSIDWICP